MKKQIYTILGALFIGLSGMSQTDAISTYFSEYEEREDVMSVMLSGKAFELAGQIEVEDEEYREYQEMASGITGMRLIVDENAINAKAAAVEAVKRLPSKFEELMTIKEKDTHVKLLVEEEGGTVYELVTVVGNESTFALMSLQGEMKMSELGKITAQMMQAGSSAFSEMEKLTNHIKIYPNPAQNESEVQVKFSEDWTGTQVRVFDSEGREVHNFVADQGRNAVSISGWTPGVYFIKSTDGDKEVSGKFIIQR